MGQTQDEGFHEIQLNGKQLVFLFMAATVVSVVIFLCGVLVGRGVRAERIASDSAAAMSGEPLQAAPPPAPTTPVADPTKAEVAPPSDKLTYFDLEKKNGSGESLKPAAEKPAGQKAATERIAPPPPAPPRAEKPERPAPTATAGDARGAAEPAGSGFAVQIAALNVRSEADAIAKRLASKGYSAYVLAPPNGSPSVFRVRVGKFNTRREAENVAARLQKEEQFKPWVTR